MTEMTFDIKIQNMRQLHCLVYHDNFCFRRCDVTFCVSSNQRQRPKFGRSTQTSERFSFPLLPIPLPLPSPSPLPLGRPDTQASRLHAHDCAQEQETFLFVTCNEVTNREKNESGQPSTLRWSFTHTRNVFFIFCYIYYFF